LNLSYLPSLESAKSKTTMMKIASYIVLLASMLVVSTGAGEAKRLLGIGLEPTDSPTVALFVCPICDEGEFVTNLDEMVDAGPLGNFTCLDIVAAAEAGLISEAQCLLVQPLAQDVCECQPVEEPTGTPVDPTEAPTQEDVDPTDAPADPTEAPTEADADPTDAPLDPTDAPLDPTDAPTKAPSTDPVACLTISTFFRSHCCRIMLLSSRWRLTCVCFVPPTRSFLISRNSMYLA
jgi:hypothetical protein